MVKQYLWEMWENDQSINKHMFQMQFNDFMLNYQKIPLELIKSYKQNIKLYELSLNDRFLNNQNYNQSYNICDVNQRLNSYDLWMYHLISNKQITNNDILLNLNELLDCCIMCNNSNINNNNMLFLGNYEQINMLLYCYPYFYNAKKDKSSQNEIKHQFVIAKYILKYINDLLIKIVKFKNKQMKANERILENINILLKSWIINFFTQDFDFNSDKNKNHKNNVNNNNKDSINEMTQKQTLHAMLDDMLNQNSDILKDIAQYKQQLHLIQNDRFAEKKESQTNNEKKEEKKEQNDENTHMYVLNQFTNTTFFFVLFFQFYV